MTKPRLYELIELKLGADLATEVARARAAGQGWRTIAQAISERSGVTVSHESLRSWFPGQ